MFSSLFAASRKKKKRRFDVTANIYYALLFSAFQRGKQNEAAERTAQVPGRVAFGDITKGCVFPQQAARVFFSTHILTIEANKGKRPFVMS